MNDLNSRINATKNDFDKSVKALGQETKNEQNDIVDIDEVENTEKREMEKQREKLTNEKDID